jgi:broad specificity phosphatase PhoE
MSIFIVRHAETVGNAARIIQMPTVELSARGRTQAALLAERLADANIARILCSDFLRAIQTAECVSKRIGVTIEFETSLRERDFGDLRGKSYDAIVGNLYAADFQPPNGENRAAFLARAALAWQRITAMAAQTDGDLLVMTHGQLCRALVEQHVHLPAGKSLPPSWLNTSVTALQSTAPWSASLVNCTAHLTPDL